MKLGNINIFPLKFIVLIVLGDNKFKLVCSFKQVEQRQLAFTMMRRLKLEPKTRFQQLLSQYFVACAI